jgi:hypothetical protein
MGVTSKKLMTVDVLHRLMDDRVVEGQAVVESRVACLCFGVAQRPLLFPLPYVEESRDLGYWTYQEIDTSNDDLSVVQECLEHQRHCEKKVVTEL